MTYTSSIVNKYGDSDKVPEDCRTLYDIISRQSTILLTDCIAESVARNFIKYGIPENERENVKASLLKEFREALEERT
jgi:hypothetical protein